MRAKPSFLDQGGVRGLQIIRETQEPVRWLNTAGRFHLLESMIFKEPFDLRRPEES